MKLLFERLAQLEKETKKFNEWQKEEKELWNNYEKVTNLLTKEMEVSGKVFEHLNDGYDIIWDTGFLEGLRFALQVFEEQKKDWFQILKDNNQYDDFIKFYGDLWEEIFGKGGST